MWAVNYQFIGQNNAPPKSQTHRRRADELVTTLWRENKAL